MKFELKIHNRNITDEDLLNDLKEVAESLGKRNITYREYNGKGKYAAGTIHTRFGNWNKALEIAGLTINNNNKNISNEEFLTDIQAVAKAI